jgi:outer membrane protein insertion porin family
MTSPGSRAGRERQIFMRLYVRLIQPASQLLLLSWVGAIGLAPILAAGPAQAQFARPPAATSGPALGVAIRDIRVEGLQRIEPGTVFSYLPIQIGDRVTEQGTAEAVRTLFATGFFKDVRIELEGDVLVISVEERPAIGAVEITGSKEFDKDQLLKALRDTGLAESRIFDRALLDRAEQELKRQYLGRGKYNARIVSTITPMERNRVAVQIAVVEGEDARIRQIRIVGAKAFKESALLEEFKLSPPTWMSWYTKADQYSRQKLTGDLEALRSFYLNRGYLEFAVDSTQVSLSPDRKDVFITVVINEGERFTVKDVRLVGDLLGRNAEFAQLVNIKSGEVFSNQRLQALGKTITDRLGELGYAFASVTPLPEIDRNNRVVNFALQVDPGRRVYVRSINISGNMRTRDQVIRREIRQLEASWFDSAQIRLSRDRIDRLGFFKTVEADPVPIAAAADQVDVNFKVEERPLGAVSLGIGISSTEKFVVTGSLSQQNFLGAGTNVSLQINTSSLQRTYSLSHFDPYWTDDGISRSIDLYSRKFNPSVFLAANNYQIFTDGLAMRFGIPYTEVDRIFLGAGAERNHYSVSGAAPSVILADIASFGSTPTSYVLTGGWSRDSRDSAIAPTKGVFRFLNVEYATPFGNAEYVRTTLGSQAYLPISTATTYAMNVELGSGAGLNGKNYPNFKNFFAGGTGSIRGFQAGGIGPLIDGRALGGSQRFVLNNELLFPFPGMTRDRTVRLLTFVDVGSVWPSGDRPDLGELRASAGFGLAWLTAVGPLKFSIGKPIRRESYDRTQTLQFSIGTGL